MKANKKIEAETEKGRRRKKCRAKGKKWKQRKEGKEIDVKQKKR